MLAVDDGHFRARLVNDDVVGPSPYAENALVSCRHQGASGRQGHMGRKSAVGGDGKSILSPLPIVVSASRWIR